MSTNIFFKIILAAVVARLAYYLYRRHRSSRSNLPLPPGPRPLPLVGNLFDIPTSREYETYTSWGKEYGDVIYASALGQHIIVLNSIEAAKELLDQRSATYSDRPFIPMAHEPRLMDAGWILPIQRYSPLWKRHRRLFVQYLNPTAARGFFRRQVASTHALLRSLLHRPTELEAHIRHLTADTLLGICYGYHVKFENDPLVDLAEMFSKNINQGILPGRYMVNIFPWLKYVPRWFPWTGFKELAAETRKLGQDLVLLPFEKLKAKMSEGVVSPSFVTNALAEVSDDSPPDLEKDVMEVAATMYGAGVETTVHSLHSCILALLLNPSVLIRAQSELDAVLGTPTSPTYRLPTFEDRPSLPYIDAILKECLRWMPVVPLGVPHSTVEEDVYRRWRIPKGSIIIANSWALLHDEKLYPDSLSFRPERFMSTAGRDPDPEPAVCGAFGFGRRVCPGRPVAETSLWIQIASLLSAFTFSLAKDQNGMEIDVSYAAIPVSEFLLHPPYFPCSIKPRSRKAEALILETNPDGVL